ncbi:MAG TPA: cyclic nucleotide-binding domain-containing protein [Desulfuromonadales bacterium]|nr:cyclic nucleotide-binding domain-containing protein [Desulfuromonadales bacterium]
METSSISSAEISAITLFKDIPEGELIKIAPRLTSKTFPAGQTIIFRGDEGYSMFILLEGAAAVTLINDEGVEYTIAELGPGEAFGEMALLTGEPRSANVKAVGETTVVEIGQDHLNELMDACPGLNRALFRLLAKRLGAMGVLQNTQHLERVELIASLMTVRSKPERDTFPGSTKWAVEFNATLKKLAGERQHVLVLGEAGTETKLAANLIHHYGEGGAGPMLYLDCGNPPPVQRERANLQEQPNDSLYKEVAQEGALFGHTAESGKYGKGDRIGLLDLAGGGVLLLDNIDQLTQRVQIQLLDALAADTGAKGKVRVIATCRTHEGDGDLDPALRRVIAEATVTVKPLRERRKDIHAIALLYLDEYNRKFSKQTTKFSTAALNMLLDHSWPLNSLELRQVVERAVASSQQEKIDADHIFLNLPKFAMTGKFNLLKSARLDALVRNRWVPLGLKMVSVPFILFLMIVTLIGPEKQNVANLIVWSVWWPFLIFSIAFTSRSWCAYCPLPVISDGVSSFRSRFSPVPVFLSRYGVWCGVIGFALIVAVEHLTHMFTTPRATALLLLSVLGGAVVTTLLYGSRSWCKHLCPLGSMLGTTASLSILEIGSNPNVCSTQCQTLDCIKDNNCPMGLHPSSAALTRECVLCLACVKSCQHHSARLNLRMPWQQMIARGKWEWSVSISALLMVAMVLAVRGAEWSAAGRLLGRVVPDLPALLHDTAVLLLIVSLFLAAAAMAAGFPFSGNWRKNLQISGYPYLFMAFAGLFNLYFYEFVHHGNQLGVWALQNLSLDRFIPAEWVTPELGTLQIVFPIISILGGAAANYLLGKLVRRESLPQFLLRSNQLLIAVTVVLYVLMFW